MESLDERLKEVASKIKEEDGKRYSFGKTREQIAATVIPANQTTPPIGGSSTEQPLNPIDVVSATPQSTGAAPTQYQGGGNETPQPTPPSENPNAPAGWQNVPDPNTQGGYLPGYAMSPINDPAIGPATPSQPNGQTSVEVMGPQGVMFSINFGPGTGYATATDAIAAFGVSVDAGTQLEQFGTPVPTAGQVKPGTEPTIEPNETPTTTPPGVEGEFPSIEQVPATTPQIQTAPANPQTGTPATYTSGPATPAGYAVYGPTGTGSPQINSNYPSPNQGNGSWVPEFRGYTTDGAPVFANTPAGEAAAEAYAAACYEAQVGGEPWVGVENPSGVFTSPFEDPEVPETNLTDTSAPTPQQEPTGAQAAAVGVAVGSEGANPTGPEIARAIQSAGSLPAAQLAGLVNLTPQQIANYEATGDINTPGPTGGGAKAGSPSSSGSGGVSQGGLTPGHGIPQGEPTGAQAAAVGRAVTGKAP
jgi:hypothetical protein